MSKKIIGKIGYCDNNKLPGIKKSTNGHYVYVRKVYNNKCDVNVVTSLVKPDKSNPKKLIMDYDKLYYVKTGDTYPIPIRDANFSKWSGIKKDVIKGVYISDIQDLGKKKIKTRHKFFIGKFMHNERKPKA